MDVAAVEADGALSGAKRPEIRLNSVVLPAPFGPISAWISPAPIWRLAPATARMPPNCFETPLTSSTVPVEAFRQQEAGSGKPS